MKITKSLTIPVLFLILLLASCSEPEVIQVIITPTPDPNRPTETATTTITPTESETPTVEATPTSTETLVTPEISPTATESLTPISTRPTITFTGPITDPDYVLPTLPPPTVEPATIPTITATVEGATSEPPQVATAGPSPTPIPGLDASMMGLQLDVNLDYTDFQSAMGLAEPTGVEWIKLQVNWAFLQPDGPNDWNAPMQLFEQQVELASRPQDMKVLLSIAKAPEWARSNQQEDGPPDDPQALADFITFMLRDTKIGQAVDAIEVWNEPNLMREWRGTLPFSGAGYMELFRPAYEAIRAYSPTMTIVTAGLAPTSNLPEAVDDRIFLQQMYASGLANYTDIVIGAHPYGWGNAPDARCCDAIPDRGWDDNPHFFFIENIEATYEVMQQNNHNVQMWITEFGWSSWDGLPVAAPEAWLTYVTASQQAAYALQAFKIGQDLPYVGPMFLWNLNFANETTVGRGDEIVGFSIINPVLSPQERPLYWQLRQATQD